MREWKDYDDGLEYEDLKSPVQKEKKTQAETSQPITKQIRAVIAGISPLWIFAIVLMTTLVVLAAVIVWHAAHDSKSVNVDKVDTAKITLTGAENLGGIAAGGYKAFDYSVKNESSQKAYVFIRVDMETSGLYELVETDGWCKVTGDSNQLIYGYGTSGALTPVEIGDEVSLTGQLHCLADAEWYSSLTGDDMDFDIYGCLVFWTGDGNNNVSAQYLYQMYLENGGE